MLRLSLLCAALIGPGLLCGPAGGAVIVAPSEGDLAVSPNANGPWRVLSAGDRLPETGFVRTSAADPIRLRVSDGELHVDADSRLRIDATNRHIEMQTGRLLLKLEGGEPWAVQVDQATVVCPAPVELNLVATDSGPAAGRSAGVRC